MTTQIYITSASGMLLFADYKLLNKLLLYSLLIKQLFCQ